MTHAPGKAALTPRGEQHTGEDMARELAVRGDVGRVYLVCRNESKVRAAQAELGRTTGGWAYDVIVMDSSDLGSVRWPVIALSKGQLSSPDRRQRPVAAADQKRTVAGERRVGVDRPADGHVEQH